MKETLKNKLSRREFLAGTGAVLLVGLLGGCKNENATVTTTKTVTAAATTLTSTATKTITESGELSGTITIGGSTTVQPLSETLAEAFTEIFPNVRITVTGGGSSVGIKSASEGTLDIGAASRELKASEESLGLVVSVLAYDGIAVIVNAAQTVTDLTIEQIKRIYAGEITNWNEVGGANENIVVVSREEGSGTRAAFEEMVMGETLITASAILQSSTGALKTTVAGNSRAIGYISMGYLDSSVNALSIDGVAGTEENAKNGSYPIVRPLLYVTKGEPEGIVKKYIDFCKGIAAQAIVAEDYISIL
ncbi:MAG: phosphate ABC transporter substrate-binding protein [Dehalococcoidales bacterium]|nr:phosphate ABC transporter substrate-binding protein [Dehalococcoidales bacterium]